MAKTPVAVVLVQNLLIYYYQYMWSTDYFKKYLNFG
jgi:hypothetical protein